jgi:hypothetical protein
MMRVAEHGAMNVLSADLSGSERNDGDDVPAALALAFAPLHKRAFGTAIGIAVGLAVFAITAVHLLRNPAPDEAIKLGLLREFFYGYRVSWGGALIGLAWGFAVGFIAGWFVAFCRNLVIAASIFITRTRAELQATRDFLDHI